MPTVPDNYQPDPTLDAIFKANPPTRSTPRGQYDDIIEKHANRVGIDPKIAKSIMRIESGGRAGEQTGSYKGLFQLSNEEFRKGGGSRDIFDPEQNTMAAMNKLSREALEFKQQHGRDPTGTDLYMVHQQGQAGYSAHMDNPEGTAWQNVRRFYKSDAIAKQAIWGNVPDSLKSQFGSVENVKSSDLTGIYDAKMEGRGTVTGTEWRTAKKAKDFEHSRGLGREEEPEEEPKTELGFSASVPDTTRIVQANVEAPSFAMGRPLTAPMLPRAGRVPQ